MNYEANRATHDAIETILIHAERYRRESMAMMHADYLESRLPWAAYEALIEVAREIGDRRRGK